MARESSTLESVTKQRRMQLLFPQVVKVLLPKVSLLTLDALRRTSQDARAAAQLEGKRRVRRGRFFVQPLVEGWTAIGHDGFDGDSETEEFSEGHGTVYRKLDLIALDDALRARTGGPGEFAWSHGPHVVEAYDESERAVLDDGIYAGWKLRVYWQPADADHIEVPKKRNMHGDILGRPGLLLLETRALPAGQHTISGRRGAVCFELEVIDSTEEFTVEPWDSEQITDDDWDESCLDTNKVTYEYSYRVRLDRLHVDPAALVSLAKTAARYAELAAERRAKLAHEKKRSMHAFLGTIGFPRRRLAFPQVTSGGARLEYDNSNDN